MRVYNFRIVGVSLLLSIISVITTLPFFLNPLFATISLVLICAWWASNYPGILLKDIIEKVGKDVGLILAFATMLGTIGPAFFASVETTEPILSNYANIAGWKRYSWYFFAMYFFPANFLIYFVVRAVSSSKKST